MVGFRTVITSLWLHTTILTILSPGIRAISDSVNLNEYINILPSTYFVKIYFDTLVSENLGPSEIPLTLLKFKYRKYLNICLIPCLTPRIFNCYIVSSQHIAINKQTSIHFLPHLLKITLSANGHVQKLSRIH
jgi:hypothetical protein